MNNFTYNFITSDGERQYTLREYLDDWELRAMVNPNGMNDDMRKSVEKLAKRKYYRLFMGRTIFCLPIAWLRSHQDFYEQLEQLKLDQQRNPLKYYAPNTQEQLDFINDDSMTCAAIIEPNRCGKTTGAYIKFMVGGPPLFPCDPTWPLFTEHGVKWREFDGSWSGGMATYNSAKLGDPIWKEMVKKWTPDYELGIYGRTYHGKNAKYSPSWGHDKILKLKSGSDIGWYTYEMDQGNYEGAQIKKWLWDEQGEKPKWDGADRGTRTNSGTHIFALTPHKVEGRPDTGGSGWMREFLDGVDTMGHKVKRWGSNDINDVPDWIYPETAKAIEFEKWYYGPKRNNNRKMLAEGKARLFAEWHFSDGLVFDEWYPEVHWIDPLWEHPPEEYTLYRSIDHGTRDPTVCLWWAVSPQGYIYIYRCYYQINKTVYQNVEKIIELSGNTRKKIATESVSNGMSFDIFEEVMSGEAIAKTALDSRSMATPECAGGKNIGWLYKQAGFRSSRLVPASGKSCEIWSPMINQLLQVDDNLVHPLTGKHPGSRMYIFNTCQALRSEIEKYAYKENSNKPQGKDDHGPTAMAYGVQIPLRWDGGQTMWRQSEQQTRNIAAGGNFWDDPMDKKKRQSRVNTLGYRPFRD